MTQLPEVEVIRKDLEKEIVGKRFRDVTVKSAAMVSRHGTGADFSKLLEGSKVEGVSRRGVYLLLKLDDGQVLVVRLGAHGLLTRETANSEPDENAQFVATFTTGGALHLVDETKAGELFIVPAHELDAVPELSTGGIDPLSDTFTWHAFGSELKSRQTRLKKLFVDESFMLGLGDLYSDEILWAAGIAGTRVSNTLSSQEVRRLYRAVFEVLYEAVKQRGTSDRLAGDHTDLFGEPGEYGDHLKVYERVGQPCARCRRPVERIRLDTDLYSYHCPACQT